MRIRKRRPTVFKLPDLNLAPSTHAGEDDDDADPDPALLSHDHPSDLAASGLCQYQQVLAPNRSSHRARRVDVSLAANSPKVSPLQPTSIFITTTAAARVSEIATAPPLTLVKEEMGQTTLISSQQRQLHENSFPSTLVAWDRIVNVQDYSSHKPSAYRIRKLGLSTADHKNQGHPQINSEDDYHCTTLEEDELHSTDGHHDDHQSAFDAFNIELGQLEAIQQLANTERSTSRRRVLCFEYSRQRLHHCFTASDRNVKGMEQFVSHASDDAKEDLMIKAVQQRSAQYPMMQLDTSTCTPKGGHQNHVGISQQLQCGRADGKELQLQQQRCGRTDGKEWQCKKMRAVGGRTIYCAYHQAKARENHAKNLHNHQDDLPTRGRPRKERKTAAVPPSSTLVMNVVSAPKHTTSQQQLHKTKRKKRSLHEILTQQAQHVAVEEVLENLCCHIQPAR